MRSQKGSGLRLAKPSQGTVVRSHHTAAAAEKSREKMQVRLVRLLLDHRFRMTSVVVQNIDNGGRKKNTDFRMAWEKIITMVF